MKNNDTNNLNYYEVVGDFGLFKAKWQSIDGNQMLDNPALADAIKYKCARLEGRIVKNEIHTDDLRKFVTFNIIISVDTIDGIELFYAVINVNKEDAEKVKLLSDLKPLQKIWLGNTEVIKISAARKEIIGVCPRCGMNVYEGPKNFYCEGYKTDPKCTFKIFKNNRAFAARGINISTPIAKKILQEGKITIRGLKSKARKNYNATFTMNDTGKYVNFDVTLASLD